MRILARHRLALVVATAVALAGCDGGSTDVADGAPSTGTRAPVTTIAATTPAIVATTTTVPTTTTATTPSTTVAATTTTTTPSSTVPTTTTATTPSSTVAATTTTTTTVPEPRTLLALARPAGAVAVFGDSTFADQTGDFQLFDLVRDGLLGLDVGADDVRNYAVPGQGIIDGLQIAEPGWHLLGSYLDARVDDAYLTDVDLAIIGIGRVDVNRLGVEIEIAELSALIVAGLAAVVERLEAGGAQVVIVPAFGVNDEMFDALQCAAAGRCDPQQSDAKFAALNDAVIDAGLPVLFDRYAGTDLDGVPGTDAAWFTEFDPGGRWPDDGQHPNPTGEELIARQVLAHLAAAFGAGLGGG